MQRLELDQRQSQGKVTAVYERTRTLDSNAYFTVGIYTSGSKNRTNAITLISSGYVRDTVSTNYISRTITGTVSLTNYIFPKTIIAKKHIRLGKAL